MVTPSPVRDRGVVIKVSLLKTYVQNQPPAARAVRTLRARVTVAGTAESMTGLKQALEAIEAIDSYLMSPNLRLETEGGERVPNSRIVQQISEEDSFIDAPDSTSVQDVQDDRIVIITIPNQTGEE